LTIKSSNTNKIKGKKSLKRGKTTQDYNNKKNHNSDMDGNSLVESGEEFFISEQQQKARNDSLKVAGRKPYYNRACTAP